MQRHSRIIAQKPKSPFALPLHPTWWTREEYIAAMASLVVALPLLIFIFGMFAIKFTAWFFAICLLLLSVASMHWTRRYFEYRREKRQTHRTMGWICLHCGYDLWGTPRRCPECGTLSPFGHWLTRHPLDSVIYEGRLRPALPGRAAARRTEPVVEKVMQIWPEFDTRAVREMPEESPVSN